MAGLNSILAGAAFVKVSMDSAELTNGLKQAQSKLQRFVAGVRQYGDKVTFVATMMQFPFKAAVDAFSEFNLKMRQVKAITSATADAMDELAAHARHLGRTTSFTTSQVSDAMVALGRLGFTAKEVKEATKPVMNLAKATGDELGLAAQIAGNNMRVFGLQTSDLGRITDIVVTTVNKSSQTLTDYAQAAAKAGPNFMHANQDIMEMSAAIGILANMGIRGSLAGTAIARSIKRFADPKVQALLDSYGVSVKNLNGELRPLHESLADIAKVMKTLKSPERIHLAEEIFEVRGSLAGLPLTVNAEAIDQLLFKLRSAKGEAARVAEEMDSGVYGAIKRLESALNDLKIEVGAIVAESFGPWIQYFTRIFNNIREASPLFKEVLSTSLKIGAVFAILGTSANLFAKWFDGTKVLLTPLKKLNDLLTGVAKKAEQAAIEEQKRNLRATANESRRVAVEKEAEAARLGKEREVLAAKEKAAKAELVASEKVINANRAEISKRSAKIEALRQEEMIASKTANAELEASRKKIAAIESETLAIKKQNIEKRGSLEQAEKSATATAGTSRTASRDYRVAQLKAQAAQLAFNKRIELEKAAEEKKSEMDSLAAMKEKSAARAEYAQNVLAHSKSELERTNRNLKASQETIKMRRIAVKEGKQGAKGLLAAEEKRIATLKRTKSELREQIILQEQQAKQAAAKARADASNYTRARNEYDAASKHLSRVPTTESMTALKSEVEAKKIIAEKAQAEMVAAETARKRIADEIAANEAAIKANDAKIITLENERNVHRQNLNAISEKYNLETAKQRESIELAKARNLELAQENKRLRENYTLAQKDLTRKQREYDAARSAAKSARGKSEEYLRMASSLKPQNVQTPEDAIKVQAAREREFTAKKALEEKRRLAATAERVAAEKKMEAELATQYYQQEKQRFSDEQRYAQLRLQGSQSRMSEAQAEIQQNEMVAQSINKKYESAISGSVAYCELAEKELAVNNNILAQLEAKAAATGAGDQKRIAMLREHGFELQRTIDQWKAEIAVVEAEKNVELSALEASTAAARDKIAHEQALQEEIRKTISYREQEVIAANKYRKGANKEARVAGAAATTATADAVKAEKEMAKAMSARMRVEKKSMTVSQRWAKAWANRTSTQGMMTKWEIKHAGAIMKTSVADMIAAKRDMFRATTGKTASMMRSAGYAAEAVAAKTAAAATIALKTALDFLSANAFMVALLAIAGAVAALNHAFEAAAKKVNELAKRHKIAADRASEETEKTRNIIKTEQEQIQYLVDLENQGYATAEQQDAAASIVEELTKKYGNLGIIIDAVTGKLIGATDAQKKLNEEHRKAMLEKLNVQLSKAQESASSSLAGQVDNARKNSGKLARIFTSDKVDDAHAEMLKKMGFEFHEEEYIVGLAGDIVKVKDAFWENTGLDNIEEMTDRQLAEFRKKIQDAFDFADAKKWDTSKIQELLDALDKVKKTREDIARVKGGNMSGEEVKKEYPEVVKAPDQSEIENASKKIAELNAKHALNMATSLQKETDAIEKQKQEYKSYIDVLESAEKAKRQQAVNNRYSAQRRIKEIQQELADLRKRNRNGKYGEQITALNTEMTKRIKQIKGFNTTITNSDKALVELGKTWSKANDEYTRQLNLAKSEDEKRQAREKAANSNLVNNWVDSYGRTRKGTIFEEQDKARASKAEDDRFQQLMKDSNFAGAMKMMKSLWQENSKAIKDATAEYNNLLKQAEEGGFYSGTMSEQDKINMGAEIERVANIIREAAARDTQLRQQYNEAKDAAKNAGDTKQASIGSFSAKALSQTLGGDSLQLRVAKATEGSRTTLAVVSTNLNLALQQLRDLNLRLAVAN
jgi:TP901 family phage tail tape measure protein